MNIYSDYPHVVNTLKREQKEGNTSRVWIRVLLEEQYKMLKDRETRTYRAYKESGLGVMSTEGVEYRKAHDELLRFFWGPALSHGFHQHLI